MPFVCAALCFALLAPHPAIALPLVEKVEKPVFGIRRQARPLVIIIPGNQENTSGVSSTEEADGETRAMRATKAASKVRDFLNDSHTVEATLYSPDTPLFVRAAQEAKLNLGRRYSLSSDEQVALAKSAGAIYIAVVGVQKASDGSGYEMQFVGIDTASRKSYNDIAKYMILSVNKSGDNNTVRRIETTTSPTNAVNSAANTLVTRLLNGPLADYGRVAPSPVFTKSSDVPTEATPTPEADIVKAALQQATTLFNDGNTGGAITLLRHTVNQSPLNLPLRMLLARTYLATRRTGEATAEIKRALSIITPTDKEQAEVVALLSDTFQKTGDVNAARAVYTDIALKQPGADWARLALADIALQQGQVGAAETQYRAVLKSNPKSKEAAVGMARLLAGRGDFEAALVAAVPEGSDPQTRYAVAVTLFDEFAAQNMTALQQNRTAWEAKRTTREALYKETVAQGAQATGLVKLLKALPPPLEPAAKSLYARRVLVASLLSQSATALQNFLETGDKTSGTQSALWLAEGQKELQQLSRQ